MLKNRIKYNSWNDNHTLELVSQYLTKINNENFKIPPTLIDKMEIFNLLIFLEDDILLSEVKQKYDIEKIKKDLKSDLGRYVSTINLINLIEEFQQLSIRYQEDFFAFLCDYNVYKRISVNDFSDFLNATNIPIHVLLMNTKIIEKYKIPIKQQLLKAPKNFEIFLTHYDSEKKSDYNFPDNISDDELNNWARRYCELDDCNLNHLKQLTIWSNKHDHKIDSKVIVKAKKKRERN